jgi:hypothetical protein
MIMAVRVMRSHTMKSLRGIPKGERGMIDGVMIIPAPKKGVAETRVADTTRKIVVMIDMSERARVEKASGQVLTLSKTTHSENKEANVC